MFLIRGTNGDQNHDGLSPSSLNRFLLWAPTAVLSFKLFSDLSPVAVQGRSCWTWSTGNVTTYHAGYAHLSGKNGLLQGWRCCRVMLSVAALVYPCCTQFLANSNSHRSWVAESLVLFLQLSFQFCPQKPLLLSLNSRPLAQQRDWVLTSVSQETSSPQIGFYEHFRIPTSVLPASNPR